MMHFAPLCSRALYRIIAICSIIGLPHPIIAAAAQPLRIMPLGDSRTAGPSSKCCYRLFLDRMLTEAGYSYDIVGSQRGHDWNRRAADSLFDDHHEGWWGWPVHNMISYEFGDVKESVGKWARAANPDVVLALLGFTDMLYETEPLGARANTTIREIGMVIDTLRKINSQIVILLANQYPFHPDWVPASAHNTVDSLNARVPTFVQSVTTQRSPVIFVDTWTGFDYTKDLCDATHAGELGSIKVARNWLKALRSIFEPSSVHELQLSPQTFRIDTRARRIHPLAPGALLPERVRSFTVDGRKFRVNELRLVRGTPQLRVAH